MHLFLWAEDSETALRTELVESLPGASAPKPHASVLEVEFALVAGARLPHLAFARQWLPDAQALRAESIRAWANELFTSIVAHLPENKPWTLHIFPYYGGRSAHRIGARSWHSSRLRSAACGPKKTIASAPAQPKIDGDAGQHRCRLIREALIELLRKKRRQLLRQLRAEPAPFTAVDSLVQLLLSAPDAGYLSVAPAPIPFEQRHLLSPFPAGEVPIAVDKAAPSRAFAKLVEAESRLGHEIETGETCVDLGAAPGSWTYTAIHRGARVIAVDRSPLRGDLMSNRQVEFQTGDAFRFRPTCPVDWLLCDVIASPEQTAELLRRWLRQGWCRHFVVTLKIGDCLDVGLLMRLKRDLSPLTRDLFLTRLCANKKEVCAFGMAGTGGDSHR